VARRGFEVWTISLNSQVLQLEMDRRKTEERKIE
jgi:hypothetical protein